jgi:hypothetical protein
VVRVPNFVANLQCRTTKEGLSQNWVDLHHKGKRQICPCSSVIKYHAMKTYGGAPPFLTSALVGGEW